MKSATRTSTPSKDLSASDARMLDSRVHRLIEEVERLRRNAAARSRGRAFPLGARWNDAGTRVEYLYRQHQLICRTTNLDEVLAAFSRIGQARPTVTDGPLDLTILDIGDRDAADLADALAEAIGGHAIVTPNHVIDAQGHPRLCPASEPLPWRGPVTDLDEPAGTGWPKVAVVDTGYLPSVAEKSGYARFSAVDANSAADDSAFDEAGTTIQPYGGHGTAATARLLATAGAESLTVRVGDCLAGGAVDEVTMVEALTEAVEWGADVISMQAGTYTRDAVPPLALTAFQEVLAKHPETVVVVAAGNDSQADPFWPAAFDWCTAVGGLTKSGEERAEWTNHGDWVDVYAPGENVTVPFPNGRYEYLGGFSAEFTEGHAIWSGTSFAAPVVAGMIARRMIERNISAPDARDVVLAEAAVAALPATGPRVLV